METRRCSGRITPIVSIGLFLFDKKNKNRYNPLIFLFNLLPKQEAELVYFPFSCSSCLLLQSMHSVVTGLALRRGMLISSPQPSQMP